MNSLMILVAATTLGVEVGWQPLADGGHEYTLQLEPRLLEVLKTQDIVSEVPTNVDIRRYRVTIGTGKLARVDGPPHTQRPLASAAVPTEAPASDEPAPPSDDPFKSIGTPTLAAEPGDERAPSALPATGRRTKPLAESSTVKPVSAEEHDANKPALDTVPGSSEAERPWTPLLTAGVLLCVSLGANLYLGWIAWEARNRYRQATARAARPAAS